MHVLVLALQGTFDLGLSALLDTLGTANELAGAMDAPTAAIKVTVAGVQRRVHTAQGFRVPLVATATARHPDAVLLPALGEKMPARLAERLTHRDVADAAGVLREWSQGGAPSFSPRARFSTGKTRPLLGGLLRCFVSVIRTSNWTKLACW
jgi:hypothetical protein